MEISHFYSFQNLPEEFLPNFFAEFAENRAKSLVLIHPWMERLAGEPGFLRVLQSTASSAGLRFDDAHAPFSEPWHLNLPERFRTADYDARMERLFAVCGEAGVRVFTWHIGTPHEGCTEGECRDACRRTLDRVVELSRKHGVKAAIEHTLHATDSASEVLRYLSGYAPEELGCCFDSGHAKVMKVTKEETDALVSRLFTAHLHDNGGGADEHKLPGEGTIDWPKLTRKLTAAPHAVTWQNEVNAWLYRYPVRRLCRMFDRLFTETNFRNG